jgi:hypothetical protein
MNPKEQPKPLRRRTPKVYTVINYLAGFGSEFTADMLTPFVSSPQAHDACRHLVRLGRLELVQSGTKGRGGRAAVYRKVGLTT